jgi:hypothetical protein
MSTLAVSSLEECLGNSSVFSKVHIAEASYSLCSLLSFIKSHPQCTLAIIKKEMYLPLEL